MRRLVFMMVTLSMISCYGQKDLRKAVVATLKKKVLAEAEWALKEKPVTVTASICARSAGGKHDFYSEGDYWWPDPNQPEGPYIQKDGQTNPGNFAEHRRAMVRLSKIVGSLGSAYMITKDARYVKHALYHAYAWFVDTLTMMNPSLLYAQAIKGKVTGRGIGIIDTIHLMEVVQALRVMENSPAVDHAAMTSIRQWFSKYLSWLTSHPYGQDEMNAENNHGTCWVMQVAAFARFTGDQPLLEFCRERYKTILLPNQMDANGSFPRELKRTKPYGYSLFNLDAMTMVCTILSDNKNDLWTFTTTDGKSIEKGIRFLYPYVEDKSQWRFPQDVMYWDDWPVAHPFMVFGAIAFNNSVWLDTWKRLDHAPQIEEVIRNLPVRNPIIWLNE
ncbi:MAG: alginate lyase family protein [Bacteroidota bacterium]